MTGNISDFAGTLGYVLALVGAITLLLVLFMGGVVSRTVFINSRGSSETIQNEVSRQFLLFTLLVAGIVGLVIVGVPLPLALGAAFLVLLLTYRWLQLLVLLAIGGAALIFVFQLVLR